MDGPITDEDVIEKVSSYDIRKLEPYPECGGHLTRAAVLLPLTIRNGEVFILLTKRSDKLRRHPSAVSFPGGLRDNSDSSDIVTALREAEEEIGLLSSNVRVIAVLTLGFTYPNTAVYPVVGLIPSDFVPVPNPAEVEFAFFMSLKLFLDENHVSYSTYNVLGRTVLSRSLTYCDGKRLANVWGFTANYCTFIAKVIYNHNEFLSVFDDVEEETKPKKLDAGLVDYFNYASETLKAKL
ncbi:peroxisomal coenzyme A diphosphatase NUDT7-like isoform X2 [Physella acuta]|nr:peroxisomal coenzyme A diphosphatase NUDT7-like isoform X2 [Physella acuta]XP_059171110.1 peroxisomal coenzyme A diphosphatase NUDT7-like isoform X2 [Physella acuta]XP_059171111.1 peroxisomal coenzyme A diphosphatase NUDT7-like isoform X2 [Physella acuta]XP_059171112.1 peroxisomal coenzyme A diphosphatase NUDT7-like isoform X2 [Physella acuta]XP_059171113.1 peroxisomal coenzyme A diphosphatase NUDT7-like isoform X2 [Physella acuta]XP_059171115.1 peroxisomal coenzyme A diphosphatase NUDT7-li